MNPTSRAFLRKTQNEFPEKINTKRRIQRMGFPKKERNKKKKVELRRKRRKQFSQKTDCTNYSANGYPGKRSTEVKERIKARNPLHELSRENPGILQMSMDQITTFYKLISFPNTRQKPRNSFLRVQQMGYPKEYHKFHCGSKHHKTRTLCADHEETAKTHQGKSWNDFNSDEGGRRN